MSRPPLRASARRKPAAPIDRPGRWKLLWRRQRRRVRPAVVTTAVLGSAVIGLWLAQQAGRGDGWRERLGHASARLGLTISDIVIEGRQRTPEPLLAAALAARPGEPILGFSVADARARIEQIAWVENATVSRRLPGTIVVHLTERRPFAVWQHDKQFTVIDRAGEPVSDKDAATLAGKLPLVVGPGAPAAAAPLLDALADRPALAARVVAAVRVGERRWNLHMDGGADVLLPEGDDAASVARLDALQASHAVLDRPLRTVDLRLPDRLVLRPADTAPPKEPPA